MWVERDGRRIMNRETGMRMAAARYLGALRAAAAPAVPELIRLLERRNFEADEAAAEALGQIGPAARAAVPALLGALAHGGWSLRNKAAAALGQIGVTTAELPELLRLLRLDISNAVYLAFKGAPPEVVPELSVLVASSDPVGARNAAFALGALGPRAAAAIPALIAALRHNAAAVRDAAVRALGEIGSRDDAVAAALRERLNDPEEQVRLAARTVLAGFNAQGRHPPAP
jgi:HEAT repeat protein